MTQNIDPEDLRVRFAAATTALRGTAYRTAPAADEPTMRVIADIAEKFAHSAIASAFGGSVNDHTGPMLTAPSAPTDADIILLEWIRWAACRIYDAERELEAEKKKADGFRDALAKQSEMHNATSTELWKTRDELAKADAQLAQANDRLARDANEKAVLSKRLEFALEAEASPRLSEEMLRLHERVETLGRKFANVVVSAPKKTPARRRSKK